MQALKLWARQLRYCDWTQQLQEQLQEVPLWPLLCWAPARCGGVRAAAHLSLEQVSSAAVHWWWSALLCWLWVQASQLSPPEEEVPAAAARGWWALQHWWWVLRWWGQRWWAQQAPDLQQTQCQPGGRLLLGWQPGFLQLAQATRLPAQYLAQVLL